MAKFLMIVTVLLAHQFDFVVCKDSLRGSASAKDGFTIESEKKMDLSSPVEKLAISLKSEENCRSVEKNAFAMAKKITPTMVYQHLKSISYVDLRDLPEGQFLDMIKNNYGKKCRSFFDAVCGLLQSKKVVGGGDFNDPTAMLGNLSELMAKAKEMSSDKNALDDIMKTAEQMAGGNPILAGLLSQVKNASNGSAGSPEALNNALQSVQEMAKGVNTADMINVAKTIGIDTEFDYVKEAKEMIDGSLRVVGEGPAKDMLDAVGVDPEKVKDKVNNVVNEIQAGNFFAVMDLAQDTQNATKKVSKTLHKEIEKAIEDPEAAFQKGADIAKSFGAPAEIIESFSSIFHFFNAGGNRNSTVTTENHEM